MNASSLSVNSIKHLNNIFTEGKWFYNYCLSQDDINNSDTTAKSIPVKIKDKYEIRTFSALSGQMKQGIKSRLFGSLMSLKARKTKGYKVGKLKFKSKLDSIPLKQFEVTYQIDRMRNRIKLQGLKPGLKVNGLHQLGQREIANAVLIRKPSGYYFKITTFGPKVPKTTPHASIGIDFGCQTQLTFSNGTKVEFQVPVNQRIKRLSRRIAKQKDSKKKCQNEFARRREYEKLTNKKKDIRNKLVDAITKNFKYVCFQDENIHAWHSGGHGKKIQNSAIGGIMADLKHKSHTPIEVSKFFASTQLCPACGRKNRLGLGERTYSCQCGYVADRDWKSAFCIEQEGLSKIPVDSRDFKVQESSANTFLNVLSKINGIQVRQVGLDECRKPMTVCPQGQIKP